MSKQDFDYTKLLRDNLYDEARVNSYSGRAMYGRRCLALSGDHSEVTRTIAQALSGLHDDIVNSEVHNNEWKSEPDRLQDIPNFDRICSTLLDYRQDQLGIGIVVYWPNIEYTNPNDGEEDDEDYDEGSTSHG